MTPLALEALAREKERRRQEARDRYRRRQEAEERRQAAADRRRVAAAQRRQEAEERRRQAAAERRRQEAERPFRETVAVNIYARTNPRTGARTFNVILAPHSATFDDLEEARRWRNRTAASHRESRPFLFVNLIRAGEAPGRL